MPEPILHALQLAYRKHHLLDDSVGSTELSDSLCTALCEKMGDDGFQRWLDMLEAAGFDNRPIEVDDSF